MKKLINYLIAISVLVIGTVFAIFNSMAVTINLVVFQAELPLAFLIIITLIIGSVLGLIATMGMVVNSKNEIRRLNKQLKLSKAEINNLRNLPFKD